MGCLEIAILAFLAVVFISLLFFAVEVAVLGFLGALVLGGLGFLFFGVAGLKAGAVLGFLIGVVAAFTN